MTADWKKLLIKSDHFLSFELVPRASEQVIYNNRYTQREFKLKFSALLKANDIKYTEHSKN